MAKLIDHVAAGAPDFFKSLWRSVATVISAAYFLSPQGTFNDPDKALAYLKANILGLVITSLIIPTVQGSKGVAQSVKAATPGSTP